MIRYAHIFYIVWNDGTKETFTSSTERRRRIYTLENQGYECGVDFTTESDLIPEDDLYF